MESTLDELRFGQRTMEDPHAATWEDGQWSKAGGDTWSPGYNIYIEGAIHEKRVEVSSA